MKCKSFFFFIFGLIIIFSCKKKETTTITKTPPNRAEIAHQLTYPILQKELNQKGINIDEIEIFLRAFKQEQRLETWIKEKTQPTFTFFNSYDFCYNSGKLGPKRQQGDNQIPEGLYYINVYNSLSNFHLSLGINYPNISDKILGHQETPGNDIYIHGGCMSIGCISITDAKIKELYTLTSIAHNGGQEHIPVHIFPFKMTDTNLKKWRKKHPNHLPFWKNLQPFYIYFETNKYLPDFNIQLDGSYRML